MSAAPHPGLDRVVLIDTNAWIRALLPDEDPACCEQVQELIATDRAATCEIVIAEVLRGAKDDVEAAAMEQDMRVLHCLSCEGMGATAAAMGRQLNAPRNRFADLLIAAVAFENNAALPMSPCLMTSAMPEVSSSAVGRSPTRTRRVRRWTSSFSPAPN